MDISEKLQSLDILHDDKARRVLNTAPSLIPNIDITELYKGVTIEQLESLNVPILQYSTQITIHGIFEDSAMLYAKNSGLIFNKNKSLGVRYSKIDYDKKNLLLKISHMIPGRGNWIVNITSTVCQVFKMFYITEHYTREQAKIDAIKCYNSTPDNLYIGSKFIASLAWGAGYATVIELGAVYQSNLWELIKELYNITESDFNTMKVKKEEELKAYKIESDKRWELERQERANNKEVFLSQLLTLNLPQATEIKTGYYVKSQSDGFLIYKISIDKKFKRILFLSRRIDKLENINKFNPDSYEKSKVLKDISLKSFQTKINTWFYMGE